MAVFSYIFGGENKVYNTKLCITRDARITFVFIGPKRLMTGYNAPQKALVEKCSGWPW